MNKILITAAFMILLAFNAISQELPVDTPQQGYATSTLREPIFKHEEVTLEAMRLNNWLTENYDTLSFEQMNGPRERLYYLIDSYVKHLFVNEGIVIRDENDAVLQMLFSWAGPLGVHGGGLIYNSIKADEAPELTLQLAVPEQYNLSLDKDLITISAKEEGWNVKIPYYFMIGWLHDMTAKFGKRMQLVLISTGTAVDKSEAGMSQATILLAHSPDATLEELSTHWKNAYGMYDNVDEMDVGLDNRKSTHNYDAILKMHKEVVVWKEKKGAFAVAYIGVDGTYQWNRQHFLDFLQSLSINQ